MQACSLSNHAVSSFYLLVISEQIYKHSKYDENVSCLVVNRGKHQNSLNVLLHTLFYLPATLS